MINQSRRNLPNLPITMLATGLCVLSAMASPGFCEDLPRQGNFTVTFTSVGTVTRKIDLGEGMTIIAAEQRLLTTNDAGQGIFHNAAANCVVVGAGGARTAYCVFTDKDGDKFLETWTRAPSGAKKGPGTLGPGTGKYKGIDGTLEWESTGEFPAEAGTYNLVGKKRGSYRLP